MKIFKQSSVPSLQAAGDIAGLVKKLNHGDISVRAEAAKAISRTGDKRAVPFLNSCLEDVQTLLWSAESLAQKHPASSKKSEKLRLLTIYVQDIAASLAELENASPLPVSQTGKPPVAPVEQSIPARLVLPDNSEIQLNNTESPFGRDDFRKVLPSDALGYISRQHIKITTDNGSYFIEDPGSTNGTKVNGITITGTAKQELKNGDSIDLAQKLVITFKVSGFPVEAQKNDPPLPALPEPARKSRGFPASLFKRSKINVDEKQDSPSSAKIRCDRKKRNVKIVEGMMKLATCNESFPVKGCCKEYDCIYHNASVMANGLVIKNLALHK